MAAQTVYPMGVVMFTPLTSVPVGGGEGHGVTAVTDLPRTDLAAPQLVMLANVALTSEGGGGSPGSGGCDYAPEEKQMVELKTVGSGSYSDSEDENLPHCSYEDDCNGDSSLEVYPETPQAPACCSYEEEQETAEEVETGPLELTVPSAMGGKRKRAQQLPMEEAKKKKKPFHCKPCQYEAECEEEFVHHIQIHSAKKRLIVVGQAAEGEEPASKGVEPAAEGGEGVVFTKGVIRCERCGYNTNRYDHYMAHLKHHSKEGDSQRVYKCTICTYTTVSQYHWKKHLRNHFPSKLYTCSQCCYFSDRKNNYVQHIRTHTGERPFRCTYCKYSSSQKTHLTRHMRTHSGERPFKCDSCSYLAANQHEVTRHARQVHNGPKPLSCPHCQYKTADRSNYKKHVELHVNPRQFLCPVCSYAASKKCNLQYHVKSRHPDCTDITMDVSKVRLRGKKPESSGGSTYYNVGTETRYLLTGIKEGKKVGDRQPRLDPINLSTKKVGGKPASSPVPPTAKKELRDKTHKRVEEGTSERENGKRAQKGGLEERRVEKAKAERGERKEKSTGGNMGKGEGGGERQGERRKDREAKRTDASKATKSTEPRPKRERKSKKTTNPEEKDKDRGEKEQGGGEVDRVERAEKERIEREKADMEKMEMERVEKEREAAEREKAERERREKDRAEKERIQREKEEKERVEREIKEKEDAERERVERERQEKERVAKERAEREKAEKERAEMERIERERVERERIERERVEKERMERERVAKEKAEMERTERDKMVREAAERERLEKEKKSRNTEELVKTGPGRPAKPAQTVARAEARGKSQKPLEEAETQSKEAKTGFRKRRADITEPCLPDKEASLQPPSSCKSRKSKGDDEKRPQRDNVLRGRRETLKRSQGTGPQDKLSERIDWPAGVNLKKRTKKVMPQVGPPESSEGPILEHQASIQVASPKQGPAAGVEIARKEPEKMEAPQMTIQEKQKPAAKGERTVGWEVAVSGQPKEAPRGHSRTSAGRKGKEPLTSSLELSAAATTTVISRGKTVEATEEDEGIHSHDGSDISDSVSEGSDDSGLHGVATATTGTAQQPTSGPGTPTSTPMEEQPPASTNITTKPQSHTCIFCDRTFSVEVEYRHHLNRHLVNVYYMENVAKGGQ
ncbi:hypothetical protein JZ751_008596 [Albula glossodonta]|uniref:C2H2-type domain-containing protein n=1 Tax=Albula glossodonta TaxID=121402 RepID=A0A8T2P764_9TELE|nr:hypothetical protein JZ751_008596 [Albula glossodonta]